MQLVVVSSQYHSEHLSNVLQLHLHCQSISSITGWYECIVRLTIAVNIETVKSSMVDIRCVNKSILNYLLIIITNNMTTIKLSENYHIWL